MTPLQQINDQPIPVPEPVSLEPHMAHNLADQQMKALSAPQESEESVLGPQDIAIPRLVIAQPTSNFEGASDHMGQWFNSVTGDYAPELNVVVVRVSVQRAVFPEPYSSEIPVLCASKDAKSPYAEHIGKEVEGITIHGNCFECPLAEWSEEDPITGKGKPPRCSLMYLYTMIDVDTGLPMTTRLKGTALQAAKKLNLLYTQFKYNQVIKLGTTQGKGTRKYFVPTIALTKSSTPEYIMDAVRSMLALGHRDPAETAAVIPGDDDVPF